jgi:hypothetical protein
VLAKALEVCKSFDAQVGGVPELRGRFFELSDPRERKFEEAGVRHVERKCYGYRDLGGRIPD